MEEFYLAHQEVMDGRVSYLVPILMEAADINQLPLDLRTYLRTHTYIDAREYDLQTLSKRIRFSMPDLPLAQLKDRQRQGHILRQGLYLETEGDCPSANDQGHGLAEEGHIDADRTEQVDYMHIYVCHISLSNYVIKDFSTLANYNFN